MQKEITMHLWAHVTWSLSLSLASHTHTHTLTFTALNNTICSSPSVFLSTSRSFTFTDSLFVGLNEVKCCTIVSLPLCVFIKLFAPHVFRYFSVAASLLVAPLLIKKCNKTLFESLGRNYSTKRRMFLDRFEFKVTLNYWPLCDLCNVLLWPENLWLKSFSRFTL